MTSDRGRLVLAGMFLVSLLTDLLAIEHVAGRMWPEEAQALVLKLLAVYSVPLGIVSGGIFAQRGRKANPHQPAISWFAIGLACLWNLLFLIRCARFGTVGSSDSVHDLCTYFDNVSSASLFLISGALTFYFVRSPKKTD